jgi:hypothetical protein
MLIVICYRQWSHVVVNSMDAICMWSKLGILRCPSQLMFEPVYIIHCFVYTFIVQNPVLVATQCRLTETVNFNDALHPASRPSGYHSRMCSGGPIFSTVPTEVFVVFLMPSGHMLGQYLEAGPDRFLLYYFQFTYLFIILSFDAI